MSGPRIILGSLIAASVRHGIFTIALPWLILYRTVGMEEMHFDSGFPAAGWVLILLGAALYIRAFAERLRMTAMVIASTEETGSYSDAADGSTDSKIQSEYDDDPAEDSRPIWSEGVHGRSRNPLLLGVVLILFGECLAFESLALLVYAALCWTGLTLYLVFAEEPALRRALGDEYLRYCRQVPRWFLRFRIR
ncbi:MAG: isoprenylcysteine carboxylmethyltransferase family protein [Gemmatimonadetes bacterium]|nr:isoprenylcysteine carboxylmethyltransferase family protein [Gemmatimonadota bacterium]